MTIDRILGVKGHSIITTQPHRTLQDVAAILSEKAIGAVVVTDAGGNLLGILSERDIVRAIARQGADALGDPVSRHMTAKVVTLTRESSVMSAMEQMTEGRFRHMPVLRAGRLEGVISIGDVVKYLLAEIEGEHQALRDYIATA